MKRISMVGVVASTVGSFLAASTVILSAGLAVANPSSTKPGGEPPKSDPYGGLSLTDRKTLDLPVGVPVYDPNPPAPEVKPVPPDAIPPPDNDDPSDEQPPVFFGEEIDSDTNSVIYLIDNSGSMTLSMEPFADQNGNIIRGNRLDRAKAELKRSISSLTDNFCFNVMFYDECTMACWPAKQKATVENKAACFAWIDSVQPDGWTNTGMAVAQALQDKGNLSIVLLSDGSPNFIDCSMNYVGTFDQHRELIRNANSQGATINAFGIGVASDPDARSFMVSVAAQNTGSYIEIN